jgi:hypothetical protein
VEAPTTGTTTTTITITDDVGYYATETFATTMDDLGTIETVTGSVPTTSSISFAPSGITTITVLSPSPISTSASSGSESDGGGGGGRDNSGLSTGAIAGVGIGVGLGVVFLAIGAILIFQRRRRKEDAPDGQLMPELGREEGPPIEMRATERRVYELVGKKKVDAAAEMPVGEKPRFELQG